MRFPRVLHLKPPVPAGLSVASLTVRIFKVQSRRKTRHPPSRPQRSGEPGPGSRVFAVLKDARRLPGRSGAESRDRGAVIFAVLKVAQWSPGPGSSPGRLAIWLCASRDPPAYQTHILRLPGQRVAQIRDRRAVIFAVLKDAQWSPGPGSSPGRLVTWFCGPRAPPAYQTHILRLPGRSEAESRDRRAGLLLS